jgi:hypothetical protein
LYEVAENVFNNMEDPLDSMKTVSAKDYDRGLANKLYEISNNVGQEQLNSIIHENMKIEEKILNLPSNTTSIPPEFFEQEQKKQMTGEFEGDSEDETDTQTASESDIIPENPNQTIQDPLYRR